MLKYEYYTKYYEGLYKRWHTNTFNNFLKNTTLFYIIIIYYIDCLFQISKQLDVNNSVIK